MRQRVSASVSALLAQKTWEVWGYVRENRNSLDSERGCKMIREGMDQAVAEMQTLLDQAVEVNEKIIEENRELRIAVSKTRCELRTVTEELKAIKSSVDDALNSTAD